MSAQEARSAATTALREAFDRLVANDAFDGSHVSLDRDRMGELTVTIAPDWLGGDALAFVVALGRELELAVALTKDGLRLDEWSGDTVRGVQAVKDVLAAEREGGDDDEE